MIDTVTVVDFSVLKDEYEKEIMRLIAEAEPVKSSDIQPPSRGGGACDVELEGTNKTYAFFFRMDSWEDTELYTAVAKVRYDMNAFFRGWKVRSPAVGDFSC